MMAYFLAYKWSSCGQQCPTRAAKRQGWSIRDWRQRTCTLRDAYSYAHRTAGGPQTHPARLALAGSASWDLPYSFLLGLLGRSGRAGGRRLALSGRAAALRGARRPAGSISMKIKIEESAGFLMFCQSFRVHCFGQRCGECAASALCVRQLFGGVRVL